MFDRFKPVFPISAAQWKDYTGCFKRMTIPSKTVLLKEGDIAKKLFLVESGCLRAWFNNKGRDITYQFFFENSTVASIESFRKKIPSPVSIETIEPSVIWWIHKKDVDRILTEVTQIPAIRERFFNLLFDRTFDYMKHFLSFIKDTPAERYDNLLKEKPWIIQRVPQHYIASYLGISSVHLSRIKNKQVKKKH